MAVKNVVAKTWSLVASFDGRRYSAWPAGDKPSGFVSTPVLVSTDIISGSMTGGEFNKGSYLRLFAYSPGRADKLGQAAGCIVQFRDPTGDNAWHEVDNYRYLKPTQTYLRNQMMEIGVQIGNFGGLIANGKLCDIRLVVNGTATNVLVGQFTTQPGKFYFVDNVAGNDATGVADDITKPYRYWQKVSSGTSFTGIWAVLTSGDTLVGRYNASTPYSDNAGYDTKNCRFRIKTGSVPTGVAGHGWIHVTSYPGPVSCYAGQAPTGAGNAPERIFYHTAAGSSGFLHGAPDNNGTVESQYWSCSCVDVDMDPAAAGNAAAVNLQSCSDHTRHSSIMCGPWLSNIAPPNHARSAGIGGQGTDVLVQYCHLHHIACDYSHYPNPGAQENHGIYCGASTLCSHSWRVIGNWVHDVYGGSAFQTHDQTANAGEEFTDIGVIGNWFEDIYRYGIENGSNTRSIFSYNNVILRTGSSGISFDSGNANQVQVHTHNLFSDVMLNPGALAGAIANVSTAGAGSSIKFQHNIVCLKAGRTGAAQAAAFTQNYSPDTPGAVSMDQNLWYDPDSGQAWGQATPGADAHAITGNPLLNTADGTYTLQTGSPALDACTLAEAQAVAADYFGIARPVTGTGAPGGTKNDVGPFEGVGT